jgi:ribosomal protein L11 methyltransferase
MEWTEITLTVPAKDAETAAAISNMATPHGIYIEDYSDMAETLPKIGWVDAVDQELLAKDKSRALIHVYLPRGSAPSESAGFISERLAACGIEHAISLAELREEDWADGWKKYYKPERVGRSLVIRPSWEPYAPKPGDIVIDLDPGSAFGTGQHETTRLCLELLEDTVTAGCGVLDMGCGSGILSIAALKLGAGRACAVDIDPNAADIARRNALANGLGPGVYAAVHGDVLSNRALAAEIGAGYDVIAANIVADVVISLLEVFYAALAPGGSLIAGGIIDSRAAGVTAALRNAGFVPEQTLTLGGWVALKAVKK